MSYLQALAVFLAVAEEKSFSAAAKKLSLTQPTVSFHIDTMERKFGCPLFVRTRRGADLTIYGRTLYENTRSVQDLLDRTERKIRDLCQGVAGKVTIGAGTIPGEYILPSILASFLRNHPSVSINPFSADSQSVYKLWQENKVPICIIGFCPSDQPQAHKIWSDEIVPVIAPRLAIEFSEPILPSDICCYPQVVRHESSASRSSVDQALSRIGINPQACNVTLQVSGNEALKRAVLAGAGIGFVSRRAVEAELHSGSLIQLRVEGLTIMRNFFALRHPSPEVPVTEALWEYLIAASDETGS